MAGQLDAWFINLAVSLSVQRVIWHLAPFDVMVSLESNGAQHVIESARKNVLLLLEGYPLCGSWEHTTCILSFCCFWNIDDSEVAIIIIRVSIVSTSLWLPKDVVVQR